MEQKDDLILQVNHVDFSYEYEPVLKDVSLTLRKGDFLGLVGPNGSGKSTLVKCVLGLLKPQKGSIRLFGQRVDRVRDRSRIGYVSQKSNRFTGGFPATVKEVVASGLYGKLGIWRKMKSHHWDEVYQAVEQVGLGDKLNTNIGKLSGGQQQRVFIARALVAHPELLILDEPTVGVDAKSTESFYELLAHLNQCEGHTLLLVTHDIGAMTTYVTQIACLNRRLFFHGKPSEFKKHQDEILCAAYGHDIQIVEHCH